MALKKKSYKIKSGDTLSQIAKDMGMSLSALKQANPKIENVNKIKVGQTITIPSLANIKGSKDPYKGMTLKMMADMDVKNKDTTKQKRVSRKLGLRGLSPNQTKGSKKSMPFSKKFFCFLTISAVIFKVVIFLCSNALFNHLAEERAWVA